MVGTRECSYLASISTTIHWHHLGRRNHRLTVARVASTKGGGRALITLILRDLLRGALATLLDWSHHAVEEETERDAEAWDEQKEEPVPWEVGATTTFLSCRLRGWLLVRREDSINAHQAAVRCADLAVLCDSSLLTVSFALRFLLVANKVNATLA